MVIREINNVKIAVNPNAANEIFFEPDFLTSKNITDYNLSPPDLCRLIAGETFTPLILTWELLDKCNFACPFCYIVGHSNHRVLRFKETKEHIGDLVKKGLLYCNLTGGEALLHKDFKDIYRFLKEAGVLVELYTNGHLVTEDVIELFKELPPYKIEISIYGVTQEQFDRNSGTKNRDYKVVLNNVLQLKDCGFNIKCKTPLNSITEDEFELVGDWCKANSIEYYYSTSVYDAYDGEKLDSFKPSFNKMIEYEAQKTVNVENKYPGTFNIFDQTGIKACYTCGVRNYGLHINANFDLLPCSETKFEQAKFNIFELGIEQSLERNRKFVDTHLDKEIKGCIGCEASSICKMCPATAEPKLNEQNEIIHFELPSGHCENERAKFNGLVNQLMQD